MEYILYTHNIAHNIQYIHYARYTQNTHTIHKLPNLGTKFHILLDTHYKQNIHVQKIHIMHKIQALHIHSLRIIHTQNINIHCTY